VPKNKEKGGTFYYLDRLKKKGRGKGGEKEGKANCREFMNSGWEKGGSGGRSFQGKKEGGGGERRKAVGRLRGKAKEDELEKFTLPEKKKGGRGNRDQRGLGELLSDKTREGGGK